MADFEVGVPIALDDFVRVCGFFHTGRVNNGYGCHHPENEDRDKPHPAEARCFQFTCPIAYALYKHEPEAVLLMADAGIHPDEWSDDGDWMLPHA